MRSLELEIGKLPQAMALAGAWLLARLLRRRQSEGAEEQVGRPRVVVVGAGFGGLNVARTLAGSELVDVLLVDRNNYHGFWPLLYQVATAGVEPTSIAYPVRAIVRDWGNVDFLMAEVLGVDFEHRLVLIEDDAIPYDYLVLAAGSANNYFGNDVLVERTYGLKDIEQAERLRNHLLAHFERALREGDDERRNALMTFAIVGAGPTGVELAGAFAELIYGVLIKDFATLDVTQARVVLIEAMDRVLLTFPESLQQNALNRLQQMGVEVMFGKAVAAVEGEVITFKDGTTLEAGTVIWTAGVRASSLTDTLNVPLGRNARIKIAPTLNLPDRPEVFVVGDMAYLEGYKGNQAYPMVASVAIQMGRLAARNILALVSGRPLQPFRYFDKGQMATIGRRAAVMESFGIKAGGFIAWLGWLFVHLVELVGFRNRLVVFANWAYNYVTYDRALRVITEPHWSELQPLPESQRLDPVRADGGAGLGQSSPALQPTSPREAREPGVH
ncbi:MAG TPA: NAD(P)/FAD-dependent oxidoreductase [Ardenticatenaceae bacterium]|nr:NAD(P)/FAD-dependent oxidoreductase [Ardenticatenaceae bacterium]